VSTPAYRALGKARAEATGREILDYDEVADMYVRKYEDFTDSVRDPYYFETVSPDEQKFVDMDGLRVIIGGDYTMIEHGEINSSHSRSFRWIVVFYNQISHSGLSKSCGTKFLNRKTHMPQMLQG
jgi:hypothetical protein